MALRLQKTNLMKRWIVMLATNSRRRFAASVVALLVVCGLSVSAAFADERVLVNFKNAKGIGPEASLVSDGSGSLFGTAPYGGLYNRENMSGAGVVFKLQRKGAGYEEIVLHKFGKGADGADPMSALSIDGGGNLFGTTFGGGLHAMGTVFELARRDSRYEEKVLYDFAGGSDGAYPTGGVTVGKGGALYGMTTYGGVGLGTIFVLRRERSKYVETILHRFVGPPDAALPSDAFVSDAAGVLYATTSSGGSGDCKGGGSHIFGCGAVIALTQAGSTDTETILYSFTGGAGGSQPFGGLVFGPDGNMYGTTNAGGTSGCLTGCGTVFRIIRGPAGYSGSTIYRFLGYPSDGASPFAGLVYAKGALYGTLTFDGNGCAYGGCGAVYRVTLKGYESLVYAFKGLPDGAFPEAALIDVNGVLFGVTTAGGSGGCVEEGGCGTAFGISL